MSCEGIRSLLEGAGWFEGGILGVVDCCQCAFRKPLSSKPALFSLHGGRYGVSILAHSLEPRRFRLRVCYPVGTAPWAAAVWGSGMSSRYSPSLWKIQRTVQEEEEEEEQTASSLLQFVAVVAYDHAENMAN